MATPDEVRASLLSSGDHGRDGCARRKVADQVKVVVAAAADRFGAVVAGQCNTMIASVRDGDPVPPDRSAVDAALTDVATAASAVVMASDLRAPDDAPATPADAPLRAAGGGPVMCLENAFHPCGRCLACRANAGLVRADDSPFRAPDGTQAVSPDRQGWRAMAMIAATRKWLKGAPESYHVDQAGLCLDDLADALQGWRARLANVERLLKDATDSEQGFSGHGVDDVDWVMSESVWKALTEIRAMIDGEGE